MIWMHVAAGFIALGAGAVALSSRKGARLHHRSGAIFVSGMLLMTLSGGAVAAMQMAAEPIHRMNVVAAVVTAYLVITALLTVTRPVTQYRWMHATAMCVALAGGLAGAVPRFSPPLDSRRAGSAFAGLLAGARLCLEQTSAHDARVGQRWSLKP